MEILKEHLNKNISLCNKSNILEIIIGKSISPNIFNTNIYSESNIKTILKNLKNPDLKFKTQVFSKNLKRFYYQNSFVESTINNSSNLQTTIEHFTKENELIETINEKRLDFQLLRSIYNDETTIINSPKFNHSEEIEQLEILINNSLSIIIEKSLGFHCKIQIFKPISIELIFEILSIFPNSSYSF